MVTPARSAHYCARCGIRRTAAGACERDGTPLTAVVDSSLLGAEVGNYVVVRRLGEGGMGAVYRAIQPSIGAEVAIKVLHATAESHADAVQRFLLEAQAVNRVRHPNLLRILDTGYLPDRRPYLVMELLDGLTLADAVGQLPWPLACHVAAEALDALDAVHEENIVHRDLKPANIFLARDGRVVVLDFGIAKVITPEGNMPVTRSGIIGTPEYMAPEQIRSRPLDRRTDIYALGILLYETITGRRPFVAAATFDMLVQQLERPPTSPREYVPELPAAIDEIVLCALEKSPERRFRSARAMAAALRSATTATRAELVGFVTAHAPVPQPVPLEGAGSRDPAESAAGPTRPEGVSATPEHEVSERNLTRETLAIDPGATMPERPSKSPAAWRSREPIPVRRRSPLLAILITAGVIAATVVVALILTRERQRELPPTTAAEVAAPPVIEPATGTLEVTSIPPGATVVIDGIDRGVAPLRVTLLPGSRKVHVETAGYIPSDALAEIRTGERSSLVLQLAKAPAPAALRPAASATKPKMSQTSPTRPAPPPAPSDAPIDEPVRGDAGATTAPAPPVNDRKPNPF